MPDQKPEHFDATAAALDGLPEVVRSAPTTIRDIPPLGIGGTRLFIVQTFRQREIGDTILLECVEGNAAEAFH